MSRPVRITVDDRMQQGHAYELVAPEGRDFDPEFRPDLTPEEMLALGVFGGAYMTDCRDEFPAAWFAEAKLSVWRAKGWIHSDDPRGWFQWYCRHYRGRRLPEEDRRQIKRWKAIRCHVQQIERHCAPCDHACRPRQRQALLHWAYDSRKI